MHACKLQLFRVRAARHINLKQNAQRCTVVQFVAPEGIFFRGVKFLRQLNEYIPQKMYWRRLFVLVI